MGHANIETTMDIYAEATELKKQEAIKALESNSTIFQERVLGRDFLKCELTSKKPKYIKLTSNLDTLMD